MKTHFCPVFEAISAFIWIFSWILPILGQTVGFLYQFGFRLSRLVAGVYFRREVRGLENVPQAGPTLICANHESFLDPPMVGSAWPRELTYLARSTLFRGFGAWLYPRLNCVPVNQEGADSSALKTCIRELKAGKELIMFPEGARSEDGKLQQAQPGVGLIVARAKPLVIPAHIDGAFEAMPRGRSLPKPHKLRVQFGKALDFRERELPRGKQGYELIVEEIMAAIAELELKN